MLEDGFSTFTCNLKLQYALNTWYFSLISQWQKPDLNWPGSRGESTALSIKGWGVCAGGGGTAHEPAATVTSSGEAPSWHLEKYEHCKTLSSKRFGGRICFFSICLRHNCPLAVWWNRAVLDSESEALFFHCDYTCALYATTKYNANTSSFQSSSSSFCMKCTPFFLCCVHEKENAGWCRCIYLITNWLVVAAAERAMSCRWCSARR